MVRLLLFLSFAVGCGDRAVRFTDGAPMWPDMLAPISTPTDATSPPRDQYLAADLGADIWSSHPPAGGLFSQLSYHRTASTGGIAPSFLDAKLKDGALSVSDWGLAQPPVYCQATLTPLQTLDLLKAAEAVDWTAVHSLKNQGCPAGDEGKWAFQIVLTRQSGASLLAETSACGNPPGYPPVDLKAFLNGVYQVEKDACEVP